ncbi:ABC transporter substrate-binding protein [Nonomuraea typhae]|uniref:ABC transporter substrate-binding protein n=1 Tax=Nonomuraea typhae TaxID=2603600 RepID=UPI0012FA42EA|nr:ABC transporter substrate-binding protein [Nonomuraea typhae]
MTRTFIVCSVLLLTAACGAGATPTTTTITISNPANVSNVPLHLAIDKGYFAAEGLTVKADVDLGSGSTVEAVVGGQVDMAWSNVVSSLSAYAKGLGVKLVALTDTAVTGSQQVLVSKNSKARGLGDLKGQKVAVLSPSTICILNVRSGLKAQGLPADTVQFTPVAPPEHANVLDSGEVAATCTSDPFRTLMIDRLGARSIYDTSSGELSGYAVGGYLVSERFAAANPKALAGFQRALLKATAYANANPAEVKAALPEFTTIEAGVAGKVIVNTYLETADPVALRPQVQRIADAMVTYGLADKPIDLSGYFVITP